MPLIPKLFRRVPTEPAGQGPLYGSVRAAMADVQAYARSHGGEIELVSVDEAGDVTIEMHGACRGCPMSTLTLKHGIEEQLKVLVPGVRNVVAR